MNYEDLISSANLALTGNQFEVSLEKAKEAIKKDGTKVDGYLCAGKAALSLGMAADATSFFKFAAEADKNNGGIFFLLGYAQAMDGNSSKALQSLTKALELNCDDSLKEQIYRMISMINAESGDYDNAIANLERAEDFTGPDYELLQQKASYYSQKRNYHQTFFVLNQMKLLRPKEYLTYSLAFNIFMELNGYDEAKAELERAARFANLDITYYKDLAAYTMFHNPEDDTVEILNKKWMEAIAILDKGLANGRPNGEDVFDAYMNAAQLYLSLEMPECAIRILDAAVDVVSSYNNGFSIISSDADTEDSTSDYGILSPEDEELLMQERWENGEFEELSDGIANALMETVAEDPEELAQEIHQYLTPIDDIPSDISREEAYRINEGFSMEQMQTDLRNSLYVNTYEMLKDYDRMLQKAKELQSSSIVINQYNGIYYELKAGKYTNKENWEKKYRERIRFWTKRMLEDPTDYVSASYRIRSCIDIGDFEEAEQLAACLPTDIKESLREEISKERVREEV